MAGVVISGRLSSFGDWGDNERPLPSLFLYLFSEAGTDNMKHIDIEAHAGACVTSVALCVSISGRDCLAMVSAVHALLFVGAPVSADSGCVLFACGVIRQV